MQKMKKFFALLAAVLMVLSMGVTAFAADDGSITITPPDGLKATDETTYTIYKVFDATVNDGDTDKVSYTLCAGDSLTDAMIAAGFSVDTAGNVSGPAGDTLSDAAIAAIKAYVTNADIVGTVKATGTTAVTKSGLSYGYYYITTTTGSVVMIDTTHKAATVEDKNTVPVITKTITGASSYDDDGKKALAQVGTDVDYKVEITVGKGAVGYKFHDKMGEGLKFKGPVTVTGIDADKYTVLSTPEDGDDITITFVDGIAADTTITITYKATITSDALQENPAENTASLDYGHSYTTELIGTSVYNAKFTVSKYDDKGAGLAGAGFVIKNEEGLYYKLEDGVVTWVESIDDATTQKSDANGNVPAFTGLADGDYTLEEKIVPSGYNKAADSTFIINSHNYTADNLQLSASVENKAGSTLPTTGGIGTTIFYVVGAILVVGASVVLITRRRMSA